MSDLSFTWQGGGDKIWPLWRHYFKDQHALIFVVDSNDRERLDDAHGLDSGQSARGNLHSILSEPLLRNAVVLVLANKQDLPNALPIDTVARRLGLTLLRQRWAIFGCCSTTEDGIDTAFDWLLSAIDLNLSGGLPTAQGNVTDTASSPSVAGQVRDASARLLDCASVGNGAHVFGYLHRFPEGRALHALNPSAGGIISRHEWSIHVHLNLLFF
jgi:hypothetical protein